VKLIMYKSRNSRVMIVLTLLTLLILGVLGCGRRRTGIQIVPLGNREVLTLSSDDVVEVMRRAGFTDEQVLEYGTELRNGLAQSGAVQIRINNKAVAVFAINRERGDCVYITNRLGGNFIYNVDTGWVGGG